VGSQISTVELAISLQINKGTVERYLDLLSKVFIIYPLLGYSNNLRKEITKSKK
jgi:predicted AAA+ superfamily ATPase